MTIARGGCDGGESMTIARGGCDGGESMTIARGGCDGGESVSAKAELATAQPATKATRLSFIMSAPSVLLISATAQVAAVRELAQVKAT
jgi:hypothetical protein